MEYLLRTLAYADIFNYPLKKEEIWRWLIGEGERDFDKQLIQLVSLKKIQTNQDYYFLPNKQKNVSLRKKREQYSAEKREIAGKTIKLFGFIPWIKLIGITGSLAMNNAEKNADIDLFFIVVPNRLWLTRGLVTLLLRTKGLYRLPLKIKNMICPNMFISENKMEIFPRNLFTAHEVVQMVPVFNRDDTHSKFLIVNSWVSNYLPNAYRELTQNINAEKRRISVSQRLNPLISALDYLAMKMQLFYMRKHRTTEIVSRDLIKFHPHDISFKILNLVR